MSDHAALAGIWQIESAELSGEKMPDLVTHKIELHLTADTYAVHFGSDIADQGTFVLGDHPSAKTLTLTGVAGTNAGRTIPAIYRFAGEHLHVCYGLDGTAPGAFASQAGAAHFLAIYRRKPPAS
ncbi:MAG: TIGR03067 domain-containing protein [Opitutaceae bacterium]